MIKASPTDTNNTPSLGALVEAHPDVVEVRSIEGERILRERLGPGVVEEMGEDGWLLVHWTATGLKAWMAPQDLYSLGPDARLVTVARYDNAGNVRATRQRVVSTAGLEHHWTVEIRPHGILRAIRHDGRVWTFDWKPIFRQVNFRGTREFSPPEDDDAEALTVAEFAVK